MIIWIQKKAWIRVLYLVASLLPGAAWSQEHADKEERRRLILPGLESQEPAEPVKEAADPSVIPPPPGEASRIGLPVSPFDSQAEGTPVVSDILAEYLARQGGRNRVLDVLTLRLSGTLQPDGGEERRFVLSRKRPDRMRLIIPGPTGSMHVAYNGDVAWRAFNHVREGWLRLDLSASEVENLRLESKFDAPLTRVVDQPDRHTLTGEAETFAGPAYVFDVTRGDADGFDRVFVHRQTLVEVRTEHWADPADPKPQQVQLLGAYQYTEPLWLPARVLTLSADETGNRVWTTIDSVQVNPGIFNQFFNEPEGLVHAAQP
ncbi:MAG: hypothetical protein ACFE0O_01740 [Opitutales bacterium]